MWWRKNIPLSREKINKNRPGGGVLAAPRQVKKKLNSVIKKAQFTIPTFQFPTFNFNFNFQFPLFHSQFSFPSFSGLFHITIFNSDFQFLIYITKLTIFQQISPTFTSSQFSILNSQFSILKSHYQFHLLHPLYTAESAQFYSTFSPATISLTPRFRWKRKVLLSFFPENAQNDHKTHSYEDSAKFNSTFSVTTLSYALRFRQKRGVIKNFEHLGEFEDYFWKCWPYCVLYLLVIERCKKKFKNRLRKSRACVPLR